MRKLTMFYCIALLGFLLGVYGEKIALWTEDSSTPLKVFPYSIKILPETDQTRLIEGIQIDSKEELDMYIQDFMS